MPFNPRTNQWEDLPLDPSFFSLLSQGRDPVPSPIRQPTVEQPVQETGAFGYSQDREPQFTPNRSLQSNRYGGNADYLNSMERASATARDTFAKESNRTMDRRVSQEQELRALEDMLLQTGKQGVAYSHPENIQENQHKLGQLQQLISALKGSREPEPTYQSPWDSGMQGITDKLGMQDTASRKEVTDRSIADALGVPTPPGGSPPSRADAKAVQDSAFDKREQKRKDDLLVIAQDNAKSLREVRSGLNEFRARRMRGDISYPEAVASLQKFTKAIEDFENSKVLLTDEPSRLLVQQSIDQMRNEDIPNLQAIIKTHLQKGNPAGVPAVNTGKGLEPESSGDYLGGALDWLGRAVGAKDAAPSTPSQPIQQPPISSSVRKAMEIKKRIDTGLATVQERGTYDRWYEVYTQALKKMDKIQAREIASQAVFGSF